MLHSLSANLSLREIYEMTLKFTPNSTILQQVFNSPTINPAFNFILTICLQGISLKHITFGSQAI